MNTEDEMPDFEPEMVEEAPAPKNKGGRPRKNPLPAEPKAAAPVKTIEVSALLSEQEIEDLRKEAELEALEDAKKSKKAEIKKQFFKDAKQRLDPKTNEERVDFILDLAEYADRVMLDGKLYFHGRRYTVARSVFDVLAETMSRTHEHQRVIDGKSLKERQRQMFHETLPKTHIGATGEVSHAPIRNQMPAR